MHRGRSVMAVGGGGDEWAVGGWVAASRSTRAAARRASCVVCRAGRQWCGVVWCGVVWCGVVWCGVV